MTNFISMPGFSAKVTHMWRMFSFESHVLFNQVIYKVLTISDVIRITSLEIQ